MEKMLITQALDEKDLLLKKINDKIARADFIATIKNNESKTTKNQIDKAEFCKKAEAAYQQINDLIKRYQKIESAIIASNANNFVETTYGRYSVAAAIALRDRLRANRINFRSADKPRCDFELMLIENMQGAYSKSIDAAKSANQQLKETAEKMRLSILGKENKAHDEKPLAVVDEYVKENTMILLDPLKVEEKVAALMDKRATLIRELETAIKVANATNYIEFE